MSDVPRTYPLPPAGPDPRFTVGLAVDVAAVLQQHGYPEPSGADLVALQQALYHYLYAGGLR